MPKDSLRLLLTNVDTSKEGRTAVLYVDIFLINIKDINDHDKSLDIFKVYKVAILVLLKYLYF